jgi:hypothetical protein
VWRTADDFLAARRVTVFTPSGDRTAVGRAYREWHRAVRAALAWARDEAASASTA